MPLKRLGSPTSKTNPKRPRHLSATRSSSTTAQFCPAQFCPALQSQSLAKLNEWVNYQDEFLDELLRHDGKGDYISEDKCSECKKENGSYKCKDCFHGCLLQCRKCIIRGHKNLPLHRIERWNGFYFEKDNLKNIGLSIQLGHGGAHCSSPVSTTIELVVVDVTGVHYVSASYCDCRAKIVPQYTQLLQAGWFPASFVRPKTVFTFECLDTFHELTLQAKTTLYDWYHTLCSKLTSANLKMKRWNRYNEFRNVMRIWRILFMCKHGGRGQHTEGIQGTKKGELTVECPACPHPEKNLPQDWEISGTLKYVIF
ncbi:hypothetical protein BDQ17DRAFT_1395169 [Cyathus striatus]|nr:hypothetical protein BDQ17DRAFT_1395169 [Cyathus striatus]